MFKERVAEAKTYAKALLETLENHFNVDPDTVDYGNVGDAGKVAQDLKDICESIGLTDYMGVGR